MQNKTLESQIMEQRAKARKAKMAVLRDAARRYNALAEQLAPVIEELWRLRVELAEPPEGKAVHFPCGITGALESVPRVFLPGEEGFIDASDPCKFYFSCGPNTGMKNRLARPPGWLPSVLGPGDSVMTKGCSAMAKKEGVLRDLVTGKIATAPAEGIPGVPVIFQSGPTQAHASRTKGPVVITPEREVLVDCELEAGGIVIQRVRFGYGPRTWRFLSPTGPPLAIKAAGKKLSRNKP